MKTVRTDSRIDSAGAMHPPDGDEMLQAFEACTLPPQEFSHRRHLQLGWAYLRRYGFPEGALRFRERLKAYVAAVGAAGKYHETVTWAYLVLMNEEMTLRSSASESFDEMVERRPDLLDHREGAIAQCYTQAQLEASEARRVFMLPRQPHRAAFVS